MEKDIGNVKDVEKLTDFKFIEEIAIQGIDPEDNVIHILVKSNNDFVALAIAGDIVEKLMELKFKKVDSCIASKEGTH